MVHAPIFLAALLAAAPAAPDAGLLTRAEVQAALNALEACRGLTGPECPPPYRVYRIHAARCRRIAPENGRESVACRVDESLDYPDPTRNTRFRDSCVRFGRQDGRRNGPAWEVLQIRDRPCEVPSMLAREPHPLPERSHIERTLIAMFSCYDTDGITDCGSQPDQARVAARRCRAIPPGMEGRVRAACRVTGEVGYRRLRQMRQVTEMCVRLDRLTQPDESPAYWGWAYIPDSVPCEVR
jgi:hypothetical protein